MNSRTHIGDLSYSWDSNQKKTSESITGVMSGYGFTAAGTTYDFEDLCISSSLPPPASSLLNDIDANGTADVNFQYDTLGRRVARSGTGGTEVYVQMEQQTIADYPVGGAASTPTYSYVYGSYIDEPVVRKTAGTGGTLVYFHRNQQYSVTAITTSTGAVAERYAYSAYGQPTILNASGTVISATTLSNRYSYTGREWDATLGLHHFRARWMSPSAGRFLGRDPIGYFGALDLLGKFIENVEGNNHLRAWTYYSTGSFLRSSPREKLSLHSKGCLICVTNGNPLRFSDPTGLDRYWIGGMHPGDHSSLCVDEYDAAGNKSGYYCCEIGVRGHGGGCTGNGPGRGCIGRIDDCNYLLSAIGLSFYGMEVVCNFFPTLPSFGQSVTTYPATQSQDATLLALMKKENGMTWLWNGPLNNCHYYVGNRCKIGTR
jgi:RHS repeat-associated protein